MLLDVFVGSGHQGSNDRDNNGYSSWHFGLNPKLKGGGTLVLIDLSRVFVRHFASRRVKQFRWLFNKTTRSWPMIQASPTNHKCISLVDAAIIALVE